MPVGSYEKQSPYWETEGWGTARLKSCEEAVVEYTLKSHHKAVQNGRKSVGEKESFSNWEWTFEFINGPNAGVEMKYRTEPRITFDPESGQMNDTARMIFCLRKGNALAEGASVNTDDYIGDTVDLLVKHLPPRPRRDRDSGLEVAGEFWYNSEIADFGVPGSQTASVVDDPWAPQSIPSDADEPPF